MAKINGVSLTEIQRVTFDGTSVGVFSYLSKPTALIGIDLNKKPGTYLLKAHLKNGTTVAQPITVTERKKIQASLGIPEKMGGNTQQAATNLVTAMSKETALLKNIHTGAHAFWTQPFSFPVANPIVTDDYGYSRDTVGYSIPHKGTDFAAREGTPILAMNRGVVRMARTSPVYGKMVVVDHGLGVMTFYLHLSKIHVAVGQLVQRGERIGLSGQTGYAEGPHLHLTLRLQDISIDPMKFMAFFK